MPVSINKRGGTLDEQEYLVKLRHQQQKELQEEKQFFDMLIKNNELMLKSLITDGEIFYLKIKIYEVYNYE